MYKPSYNIHQIRGVQQQKKNNPHKVLKFVLVFSVFLQIRIWNILWSIWCFIDYWHVTVLYKWTIDLLYIFNKRVQCNFCTFLYICWFFLLFFRIFFRICFSICFDFLSGFLYFFSIFVNFIRYFFSIFSRFF